MNKKILVIGSLNMDMVTQMENMPVEGETVLGNALQYVPGGKGANQACAAGGLGGDVVMLGCIGDDEFGHIQNKELQERNVNTNYLKVSKTSKTGTAIIYLNTQGNNSIVVIQGANLECDISYLKEQEKRIHECDYLLLQMEIPYESIYFAIRKAKEKEKIIILNPAPAPENIPDDILSQIDYITPNETELMKLTNTKAIEIDEIIASAEMLLNKGVKNVIVTLGERGALLVNRDKNELYPTKKVKTVDTTAAGDCFNGALAVALAGGKTKEEAIIFANIASAIAVTRKGAQASLPKLSEILMREEVLS